jgi:hypothetical protein
MEQEPAANKGCLQKKNVHELQAGAGMADERALEMALQRH